MTVFLITVIDEFCATLVNVEDVPLLTFLTPETAVPLGEGTDDVALDTSLSARGVRQ